MKYDQYRHDHDKRFGTKIQWILKFQKFWQSDLNRWMLEIAEPSRGERAVDVGAGMGPATVQAAKRGTDVLAVDPSRIMRTVLSLRRVLQRSRVHITVAAGVAESLPVEDKSVDVLWTVNALHHWVDLSAAFDELARVLVYGGRIVLVDEDFTHPDHPLHATHHGHEGETTIVDVVEIENALDERGFTVDGSKTSAYGVPVKLIQATYMG